MANLTVQYSVNTATHPHTTHTHRCSTPATYKNTCGAQAQHSGIWTHHYASATLCVAIQGPRRANVRSCSHINQATVLLIVGACYHLCVLLLFLSPQRRVCSLPRRSAQHLRPQDATMDANDLPVAGACRCTHTHCTPHTHLGVR